jgi:hypothetical protein
MTDNYNDLPLPPARDDREPDDLAVEWAMDERDCNHRRTTMHAPLRILTLALATAESNQKAIGEEPYPGYKNGDLARHIAELKNGIAVLRAHERGRA